MWVPKAVAEQVLVDRSTGRITSGQRVNLNSVESAGEEERDGLRYIVFEHVSQVCGGVRGREGAIAKVEKKVGQHKINYQVRKLLAKKIS